MGYSIKGRATNAKLGEADVRRMRREHSLGLKTPRQLAQEFGLAAETVRKVLRWETFAWVGEEGPGGVAPATLPPAPDGKDYSPEAVLARLQAQGLAPASPPPTTEPPPLEELLRKDAEAGTRRDAEVLAGLKPSRVDGMLDEFTGGALSANRDAGK